MKKKLLALFLAVIILLSFSACIIDNNNTETTDNTTNTTTNAITETTEMAETTEAIETIALSPTLELVANGISQCVIVRPYDASDDSTVGKAATAIYTQLNKIVTDNGIKITTDYLTSDQEYDPDTLEILVGLTGYAESQNVISKIGYGDYIVAAEGNKIVVGAWVDDAVEKAAFDLISHIISIQDETLKEITFDRSTVLTGTYNSVLNLIPAYENGTLESTYDCGNNSTMAIISDTTVDSFNAYAVKLQNFGFEFYTNNIMASNLYATYTSSKFVLNIIYTEYDKITRIIIEAQSQTALPGLESENTYTKVKDSTITMAGLDYGATTSSSGSTSYQNGICLIVRLENNTFIVYDGGFNREHDSLQIYNILQEQSGTSRPVIAAWIFSHAHGDHMGAFLNFSNTYSSLVKVEKFILNRPSSNVGSASDEGYSWSTVYQAMNKFSGAEIIKAHPGQVFYLCNATVKILYTLELYAPKDLTYFNTSSLALSVEVNGFKMMWLGDVSEDANSIMCKAYGDYLESDLTTVSHHGYFGGTTQLYTYIKPTYVLWPMGAIHYESYKSQSRNSYFFASNTTVKKLFVAKGYITTLPLPYTGTGEIIT